MILYAPFANYAFTQSLLNLQGFQYDNFLLKYKENNVYAYKNGVDCSKEFLEKYNKNLIDCMPKIEFLSYDKCRCLCDFESENFKNFNDFLKNIDSSKISVIPFPIDITCLKFILKQCHVYNFVVNPYEFLMYIINTYSLDGRYDLEYVFNYFDVCLELKSRGFGYKQLEWKDFQFFNEKTLDFDFSKVDEIVKGKSLTICKNYYNYSNKKVNLLKEFKF